MEPVVSQAVSIVSEQYDPLLTGMIAMAFSLKVIMTSVVMLLFLKTFEIASKGAQSWKRG